MTTYEAQELLHLRHPQGPIPPAIQPTRSPSRSPPLPEESGLPLEEYLAMQQAIGHSTRFRILRILVVNDGLSAAELTSAVDIESHNFHYHLDELVDVGLGNKRQRRIADSQGFYTSYQPTAMGRGILEHDVEELMRSEREFNDAYS